MSSTVSWNFTGARPSCDAMLRVLNRISHTGMSVLTNSPVLPLPVHDVGGVDARRAGVDRPIDADIERARIGDLDERRPRAESRLDGLDRLVRPGFARRARLAVAGGRS